MGACCSSAPAAPGRRPAGAASGRRPSAGAGGAPAAPPPRPRLSPRALAQQKRAREELSRLPGVAEAYDVSRLVGAGVFGVVLQCKHRESGAQRCIKLLRKVDPITKLQAHSEKEISSIPNHVNLMTPFEVYETESALAAVYEYCSGGEVLFNLSGRKIYTEATVCVVVKALLRALCHLHKHYLAHMDVKPQNILFARPHDPDKPFTADDIRLIDYGSLTRFDPSGPSITIAAGTPYFAAPEVLRHVCHLGLPDFKELEGSDIVGKPEAFDERCDVYSAAVVAFILLVGFHPFTPAVQAAPPEPMARFVTRVLRGQMTREKQLRDSVSQEAVAMVRAGLALHFRDRPDCFTLLEYEWFKGADSVHDSEDPSPHSGTLPVGAVPSPTGALWRRQDAYHLPEARSRLGTGWPPCGGAHAGPRLAACQVATHDDLRLLGAADAARLLAARENLTRLRPMHSMIPGSDAWVAATKRESEQSHLRRANSTPAAEIDAQWPWQRDTMLDFQPREVVVPSGLLSVEEVHSEA
eukprot:TRINITY_DN1028_c0_g1_i5.p1 TRINITY_DN1028_c0_g1~~TRINITY_DN1028_c0_g1_i5.p1  ORF type:complete len:546 (+),score=143.21 TRINITY_DN1028_c0_g1_i5:66-1640(+)